ncbi:hypothetical protein P3X46_017176 [Hevea brasiliensis]|uniref:Uncharacterized protein n=2 Tax=Hevea brasiliensis TaxID=3981 RepID=A0A6A6LBT3_HEVBR|nr:tetraspanin-8-like [Hevea brasiliensis]KAF2298882.1 hypothetical protein GH714_028590 [Hevea brasiliensis]KAJ9174113.1 hypothetical protein P3X46_017176 [Hevea brasiliensis]
MVRVSNTLVTLLNIIFLLVGLAVIAGGVYLHVHGSSTDCQKFLKNSLVILGAFLFLVSFLRLTGSCCRSNFWLWLYLILLFLMIVGLVVFTIFAFVVTNESAGKALSGRGFKDHRLGDYSHWLQNHFVKGKKWDVLKSCLIEAKVCKAFTDDNKQNDFLEQKFSPTQGGCCKPPTECGFHYRNGTTWKVATSGPAVDDSDCKAWSADPKQLCYNCNSCKAGVLATIRKQWRTLAIFLICVLIFTLVVFSTACCAKKNNSLDKRYNWRRNYIA